MTKKNRLQKRKEQVDENARFQAKLKHGTDWWIVPGKGRFVSVSRYGTAVSVRVHGSGGSDDL